MLAPVSRPDSQTLQVACLCAAWCHLCADYAPLFEQVVAQLRERQPQLQSHWIDIEDEADLVGELDVVTFPTVVVFDDRHVWFAGPLTPQPETLERVLRAALDAAGNASPPAEQPMPVQAFVQQLRRRGR